MLIFTFLYLLIKGQEVQDFLYLHNKPPPPPVVIKSFYEQRLENKQIYERQQEQEVYEHVCDEKKKIEDQLVCFK
jgi:hypothetical protein